MCSFHDVGRPDEDGLEHRDFRAGAVGAMNIREVQKNVHQYWSGFEPVEDAISWLPVGYKGVEQLAVGWPVSVSTIA